MKKNCRRLLPWHVDKLGVTTARLAGKVERRAKLLPRQQKNDALQAPNKQQKKMMMMRIFGRQAHQHDDEARGRHQVLWKENQALYLFHVEKCQWLCWFDPFCSLSFLMLGRQARRLAVRQRLEGHRHAQRFGC